MIKVNDTKQNVNSAVLITTINCDGVHRYWTADSIEEFHKWWWDDNYGGPASDDRVVELIIDGKNIDGIMKFEDIVLKYEFNKEV